MERKGAAVLFSEMAPGPELEAEFNAWYDEDHIPLRMPCPGFIIACRYKAADAANYLAVYELADIGVLRSDAYRAVKDDPSERTTRMLSSVTGFTRYLARETSCRIQGAASAVPLDAPVLYAVLFNVPEEGADTFDAWYEQEHVGLLMENPDWLMVRRFTIAEGMPQPFTRLALHYLANEAALSAPERERARAAPWRKRLAENSWFKGTHSVFQRHRQRQHGSARGTAR